MKNLFTGVRVLDLTRLLPGPFATMIFADGGADVIKIEDTKGGDYARYYPPLVDDLSTFFSSVNRGKRSIALDLKHDVDLDLFRKMVAHSDVVIESFRPGVMEKLGIDYTSLKSIKPDLIFCAISGYGQTGGLEKVAGHDLNYLARTGLLSLGGQRGTRPTLPPFQLADLAGGALYAVAGIAAALFQRERTGEGEYLDISMTEGALSFAIPALAQHRESAVSRGEEMLTGGVPCYDVYETKDGRYLAVAPLEPKFWVRFLDVIDRSDLVNESYDSSGETREQIAAELKKKTLAAWGELFDGVDACTTPVASLDEALADPLFKRRGLFYDLDGVQQTKTPLSAGQGDTPAPKLDQHGEEIRAWLDRVQ